jgi:hypothetical protein
MTMQKKPKPLNIRPFTNALRKHHHGWCKVFASNMGGVRVVRVVCFELQYRNHKRKLDLQLWGDGAHRVSHWFDGSMNTPPTDFQTVPQMLAAIRHEVTRTDNTRHPLSTRKAV